MVKIRFFDGVVVVHGIVVYNGQALFAPIVRPRCQFVYLNLEVVLKINYCWAPTNKPVELTSSALAKYVFLLERFQCGGDACA